MARISHSPVLKIVVTVFATMFIGFGINCFTNPTSALSFFNYDYPNYGSSKRIVDGLLMVYGIRDIAMGLMLLAGACYGHLKVLGWLTVVSALVAAGDGWVCWVQATGAEWNHWGYGPVVGLVGTALLGMLDM